MGGILHVPALGFNADDKDYILIDYESDVKAIFAQHLADDLHGRGRVEAAAYKTAKDIYLKGVEDGMKAAGLDDTEIVRLIAMVG